MAAEGEADKAARSHWKSYGLFTGLMKYGAILSFITAFIVILIISD